MRINHNPNLQLQNILGMEQASRKEAQEKAAESAKAHAAEEALRLQDLSDSVKKIEGDKQNPDANRGRRNARYLPNGAVEPEGPDSSPADPSNPPPPRGGIDLRA